jgi:holo-[acyl-carrier protein] synthase
MGVVNLPSGGAKAHLERLVPAGYEPRIDLTLTDEPPLASAVVIISAVAKG